MNHANKDFQIKSVNFQSDRQTSIFSQLPRSPIVSSSELNWTTIQVTHFRQPAFQLPEHKSNYHGICLNTGKVVKLERKIEGKFRTANSIPGNLSIIPANLSQSFTWNSEADFLLIYLKPDLISQLGYELYQSNSVELVPQIKSLFDPLIQQIALTLRSAVKNGIDNNLYADSMANALTVHLLSRYSNRSHALKSIDSKLSPSQLNRVIDYIYSNLDKNLTLTQLATVLQLSEYHFARLFKQTTGKAPHQFQLQCRIERAQELLLQDMAIAEVAQTTGFSSQSHFNYHFKRQIGMTPKQYLDQSNNL
ncbi:MAG: helix-turn-helix domain-containing protein [Waterburya sp.]